MGKLLGKGKFGEVNLNGQHSFEILPHRLEKIKTEVALKESIEQTITASELRGMLLQAAFDSA